MGPRRSVGVEGKNDVAYLRDMRNVMQLGFVVGAIVTPKDQKDFKHKIETSGEMINMTDPNGERTALKAQKFVNGYILYEKDIAMLEDKNRAMTNQSFQSAVIKATVLYALSCLVASSQRLSVELQLKPTEKATVKKPHGEGKLVLTSKPLPSLLWHRLRRSQRTPHD